MRMQLARPDQARADTRSLRPDVHHARHHDDLLVRLADPVGLRQLPDPADDRRARHGVPAAERVHLLELPAFGLFLYASPLLGQAPHAGWFAYVPYTLTRVLARLQHGLLRAGADLPDDLDDRRRHQLPHHDPAAARAGHGDQPHAAVLLQHADHLGRHRLLAAGADRRAACSSSSIASWGTHFFDVARGGSAAAVAAPVLVLRPPVGLRHLPARHRHDLDDAAGVRAPPDRRLHLRRRRRRC